MKPIRIFRHVVCEGPGYLGQFLDRRAIPWEVVCLDEDAHVPQDLGAVSALVFLGGSMSVNDPLHWIAAELSLIQRAYEAGVPMMGTCFGAQLMSKALGGDVVRGLNGMEIGWYPVRRVKNCRCADWLTGLSESIESFHWHGETFTPPPGSRPLLESLCFRHQAFALGDHLAMQFHLEMTEEMVLSWVRQYPGDLQKKSTCSQSASEITRDLRARIKRLHAVADVIYGQWLERVVRHCARTLSNA
jgi:GMP synthase-like glutamine amidotransferase